MPRLRPLPSRRSASLALVLASPLAVAETSWTLQALEDFPAIDAGEVPYYRDVYQGALAVDASIVAYRSRFARATAPHPGPGGTYDLVLTTLAEVDGETVYRLLVDGEVVRTDTNPVVDGEFVPHELVFEDVALPVGAELGVESAAVSNGRVPENGGFAFARGRWRSLTIAEADPTAPDPEAIELSVSIVGPADEVRVGDRLALGIAVANASAGTVATAPRLELRLPPALVPVPDDACVALEGTLRCDLAEIAPGADATVEIELDATAAGPVEVLASVSADQPDGTPGDDAASLELEVLFGEPEPEPEPEPETVTGPAEAIGPEAPDGTESANGTDEEVGVVRISGGAAAWPLLLLAGVAGTARARAAFRPSPSAPCARTGRPRRSRAGS